MPRHRKRIPLSQAEEVAVWIYRDFAERGASRVTLNPWQGILQQLRTPHAHAQQEAVAELQARVDALPAPIWARCAAYLRMNKARRRRAEVTLKVPRALRERLAEYTRREGLPSVVAALEKLLDAALMEPTRRGDGQRTCEQERADDPKGLPRIRYRPCKPEIPDRPGEQEVVINGQPVATVWKSPAGGWFAATLHVAAHALRLHKTRRAAVQSLINMEIIPKALP